MKLTLELNNDEGKTLSNLIANYLAEAHFGRDVVEVIAIKKDDNSARYTVTLTK